MSSAWYSLLQVEASAFSFFVCLFHLREGGHPRKWWLKHAPVLCREIMLSCVQLNRRKGEVLYQKEDRSSFLWNPCLKVEMHFIGCTVRSQNLGGRYTVGLGESPEQGWVQGSVPESIQQLALYVEGSSSSNSAGKMLRRRVENLEVGSHLQVSSSTA